MINSGFISLTLHQSQSPVTVSKTAILFIEENKNNSQITHLHCVGGITHVVNGSFDEIKESLPKFVQTQRVNNGEPRVAIHDWNISYVEKNNSNAAIIYFTESGVSVSVLISYEDITEKLHSL